MKNHRYILAIAVCLLCYVTFFSSTKASSVTAPQQDSVYVWVPTAITPDGDNLNDTFNVVTNGTLYGFRLTILNVWGERIFTTDDIKQGWDGTYKGKPVAGGVYAYAIKFRRGGDNLPETLTGMLHVIR